MQFRQRFLILAGVILLSLSLAAPGMALNRYNDNSGQVTYAKPTISGIPNIQFDVHNIGKIALAKGLQGKAW